MTKRIFVPAMLLAAWIIFPALSAAADDVPPIPAGTTLQVRLITALNTRANENGDPWTGKVIEPIFAGGQEIVPAGSTVEGRVTFVKPPGRVKGRGEMRLVLDKISTAEGLEYSASVGLEDAQGAEGSKVKGEEGTIQGPGKSTKGAAIETGVGAGVGASVGAIAAGGSGALYGAGIGAAVGILHSMLKRHKDVVIPQGTELTFVIERNTRGKTVQAKAP